MNLAKMNTEQLKKRCRRKKIRVTHRGGGLKTRNELMKALRKTKQRNRVKKGGGRTRKIQRGGAAPEETLTAQWRKAAQRRLGAPAKPLRTGLSARMGATTRSVWAGCGWARRRRGTAESQPIDSTIDIHIPSNRKDNGIIKVMQWNILALGLQNDGFLSKEDLKERDVAGDYTNWVKKLLEWGPLYKKIEKLMEILNKAIKTGAKVILICPLINSSDTSYPESFKDNEKNRHRC